MLPCILMRREHLDACLNPLSLLRKEQPGTSLAVQWLRICFPRWGIRKLKVPHAAGQLGLCATSY